MTSIHVPEHVIEVTGLCAGFGQHTVLHDVSVAVPRGVIVAVIGSSGSGKTTFLRSMNLLDLETPGYWQRGKITFDGEDIRDPVVDPNRLRQRIGMVFQKPVVFPTSIAGNVLFGVRHLGLAPRARWPGILETTLVRAGLFAEVKDRLDHPAHELSQGQQQRLTIARALAVDPEVLLMDEPTASLDPHSVDVIEALLGDLTSTASVILVTHNLSQAQRVSQRSVFFREGRVLEQGPTRELFAGPKTEEGRRFLSLLPCS